MLGLPAFAEHELQARASCGPHGILAPFGYFGQTMPPFSEQMVPL